MNIKQVFKMILIFKKILTSVIFKLQITLNQSISYHKRRSNHETSKTIKSENRTSKKP